MFPYSPIPEEPATNPIREGYKSKLNARDYNAGETELFVSVYEVLIGDWGGEREREGVHVCIMCAWREEREGACVHHVYMGEREREGACVHHVCMEREREREGACVHHVCIMCVCVCAIKCI